MKIKTTLRFYLIPVRMLSSVKYLTASVEGFREEATLIQCCGIAGIAILHSSSDNHCETFSKG